MGLVDRVLGGDRGALARLATLIERDTDVAREAMLRLYPHSGATHIVGITGAPGAGKSTLVNALIKEVRRSGRTIGVVAIDPTSSASGGAVLGDRIRMLENWSDDGVFIRSMASRGQRGGIAPATAGITHLFDAAGFDLVIVETVGIGQDEIEVAGHVHTVVLLQVPGLGDGIQAIKAGVLEVADVYVVNKADRPGANEVARELRAIAGPLGPRESGRWSAPIVKTNATDGTGIAELCRAIDRHRSYLQESREWTARTETIARSEIRSLLWRQISQRLMIEDQADSFTDRQVEDVARRRMTPAQAASRIFSAASRTRS